MSEYVSALLVSEDTLNVNGVLFDRRTAAVTATPMDNTAKGRRIESLYHGQIQRMELCERIAHLEQLARDLWQLADADLDPDAARRARSATRALGLDR
jgi:hypothetical protein